jgi:NADH-quinone oxidoreductase subunit M
MNLRHALPFAAVAFVLASAASMGIPGFSGFAAEVTILLGLWKTYPAAVWATGLGMVLVAAFTLRALVHSFFGETAAAEVPAESFPPITLPEKIGAGLLLCSTLTVGVYPKLLFDRIVPAVEAMKFLK